MLQAVSCGTESRSSTRAIPDVALQFLELIEAPLFLFAADATVLWLNAAAHRFLERVGLDLGPDGIVRSNGLQPRRGEIIHGRLRDLLQGVHAWKAGNAEATLPGLPSTRFHFYRLTLNGEILVVCVPITPWKSDRVPPRLTSYGLTETEKKIAAQLIKGLTVAEIAIANGNSVLTVRTHIKRIYSKIGVNRREKLFAQLVGS